MILLVVSQVDVERDDEPLLEGVCPVLVVEDDALLGQADRDLVVARVAVDGQQRALRLWAALERRQDGEVLRKSDCERRQ